MAEPEQEVDPQEEVEDEADDNPNYKAPAPKKLDEIMQQDADDESLVKYKETLLGANTNCIIDPDNPHKVILKKLSLLVEGRDETSIDLTLPKDEIKKQAFVLKEGVAYKIQFSFQVQREIVCGLRYHHVIQKNAIAKVKNTYMMGSYGPKPDLQTCTTPEETAPSGLLSRGDFKIKSKFYDDDNIVYLDWEWHLTVKKDWA